MSYQKQIWREYDDTKTELQNMQNGAVVTPERLNHIETGIANSAVKGSGVSTNLPLMNGWIGTVRWRKSDGDVVTIEVDIAKSSSISPLNDIATLPASIRTFEKVLPVVSITTGDIEFLYINGQGVLRTPANSVLQPGLSYHGVITYTI